MTQFLLTFAVHNIFFLLNHSLQCHHLPFFIFIFFFCFSLFLLPFLLHLLHALLLRGGRPLLPSTPVMAAAAAILLFLLLLFLLLLHLDQVGRHDVDVLPLPLQLHLLLLLHLRLDLQLLKTLRWHLLQNARKRESFF